jgi:hypothetical protein
VVRTIYRLLRVWGATRAVLPDVRFSVARRFFYTERIYIRRAEVSLSGLLPFHAFTRIHLGRNVTEEESHADLFWPEAIRAE